MSSIWRIFSLTAAPPPALLFINVLLSTPPARRLDAISLLAAPLASSAGTANFFARVLWMCHGGDWFRECNDSDYCEKRWFFTGDKSSHYCTLQRLLETVLRVILRAENVFNASSRTSHMQCWGHEQTRSSTCETRKATGCVHLSS